MFSLMSIKSKSSTSSRSGGYNSVVVRHARPQDAAAIHRLAILDSQSPRDGAHLVAEADGEVIAALAIASGAVVADPFRWTADVVELMKVRAEQLREGAAEVVAAGGAAVVQPLRTQMT